MALVRIIVWLLFLYMISRIVTNVMKVVRGYNAKKDNEVRPKKEPKYMIKSEDVIDAKFEEINPRKGTDRQ